MFLLAIITSWFYGPLLVILILGGGGIKNIIKFHIRNKSDNSESKISWRIRIRSENQNQNQVGKSESGLS